MPNGASFAAVLNVLKIPFRVFCSDSGFDTLHGEDRNP
jgi:hypothetical protein